MTYAKRLLTYPSGSRIYLLMAAALMVSIGCSYGAAMINARPQAGLLEKLLMAASFASFASIGCLSLVADCLAPSKARRPAIVEPLEESQRDTPIVGLRVWRAHQRPDRTTVLQSWYAQHALWPGGRELTAEPASPGIHAFKSAAALLAYVGREIASPRAVVGTVALWGTVIEHESGWTAEKAYPLEIHCANADVAAALRRMYGCETAAARNGLTETLLGLQAKINARGG